MTERDAAGSWQLFDDEAVVPDGPSPGTQLRAVREAKGLAVQAVADALHLTAAQIQALEADDHGAFPAPIFVHGYLRGYARLLGIDAEPLVAAVRPSEAAAPPLTRSSVATGVRMGGYRTGPAPWLLILFGVTVVAAALIWLGTRGDPADADTARLGSTGTVTASGPAQEEPGDFDAAVIEDAQARVQAQEEEAAMPAAPAPARSDELVLRFSGRSWVEVSDASGRRLAVRMGEEGEELRLQGQAPFDVLLGNAPNVTLEYNGSPYTDIPASRQNVANFRLGRPNED